MKIKHSTIILTCLMVSFLAWFGNAVAQNASTISGRVTDAGGAPLEGVSVEVQNTDFATVTKKDGAYKIVVTDLAEAKVKFSLKDYDPVTKSVSLSGKPVPLDAQLSSRKVQIKMTEFRKNAYIRGQVTGLDPADYSRYKILVYVSTDNWYIHPFAVNEAGTGYAAIDREGKWQIQTVWRGYQAFKVAFLLVRKEVVPPSKVPLSEDMSELSLLSALKCDDRYLIIDAPEGI